MTNDGTHHLLISQSQLEKIDPRRHLENLRVPVEIMTGKSSPKNYRTYMLVIAGIFLVVSVYAQLSFPETYSFLRNTISDQGSIKLNPNGHQLWNIG
ncbi:MAG: hypothetical protein ACTSYU_06905, partial [Promethearchaeota archaeon]